MSEAYWKERAERLGEALQEAMGWNWLDDFSPPEDVVNQCNEALVQQYNETLAQQDDTEPTDDER